MPFWKRRYTTTSLCRLLRYYSFSKTGINKWNEEITTSIKIEIENKWKSVVSSSIKNRKKSGNPYYVLSMFPYPSGNLHMGHVRVYTISDSIAHFYRMSGYDVIHPMGWDAFGLPAENAAIERNVLPDDWTKTNITNMKKQLNDLGCCFDWDREINTSDSNYYKWTQSLFLELLKVGLVYKKKAFVNWDPIDETVLADEQVDANGCSWRSGAKVERKELNQWFIKTTNFAKSLFDGLDTDCLEGWNDIIDIQKHWIGECNGINVDFEIIGFTNKDNHFDKLTIWVDNPEKITCGDFIAISSSHVLNKKEFYECECSFYKKLSVQAVNPISNERLNIYVTDDITYPEGSDSYLGCSAIIESDIYFSKQIGNQVKSSSLQNISEKEILNLRQDICDTLKKKQSGGYYVSSKLKDWLISRQRYWGTPIPIIYCSDCGTVPVPSHQLPVVFPNISMYGKANIMNEIRNSEWINTHCPNCGGKATRDIDTMDTFVDSSWYFLRYLDPKNNDDMFNSQLVSKQFPVNLYIGGKEHAVLHLYYARFITHFLHSIGKVSVKEPFLKLLVQGMVLGKTFKIKETGQYISEKDVNIVNEKKGLGVTLKDNKAVEIFWDKMSKSKHNGVEPSVLFKDYGCDTTRLFVLSEVAPWSPRKWSSSSFSGIMNWQKRIWYTVREFIQHREKNHLPNELTSNEQFENDLKAARNKIIYSVTHCYAYTHNFSSAIARLQSLTNFLRKKYPSSFISTSKEYEYCLGCLIIMLTPLAPHFASELWSGFISTPHCLTQNDNLFNWDENVLQQIWPLVDENYKLQLICQINGNVMGHIPLLRPELNNLTKNTATSYIFNDSKLNAKIKKEHIAYTNLNVYTNCFAEFNFIMDYQTHCNPKN